MAGRYINGVWVDDEEQQPGEEFAGVIDSNTGEYTPAIPDAYDSSVSAEGFSTEKESIPATYNVGPDPIDVDPNKAATAQDAKVSAAIATRTFGDPATYPGVKLYPSEQKQVERLWAQEAAAKTRFNQLSLAGGKDDEVEAHVAQAILAFAPIVAGYMLGGNELGAHGAKVGLQASAQYDKERDTYASNKKKLTQAQQQMLLEDSQARQKQIDGLILTAERRNNAGKEAVNRLREIDEAGLGPKGTTVSITNDMSKAASVDAAKEFTKQKFAANSMLTSTGITLDAIQSYLAKRPEARGESFAGAAIRNMKDSVTKPEEAALLESALSLDTLNTANALIKGVVSDNDQVKIDAAAQRGWNVPMETMEEVVKAMGRRLLKLQEQNRLMMDEMQSPDGWRAPAPAESEMARRLGVAPQQRPQRKNPFR